MTSALTTPPAASPTSKRAKPVIQDHDVAFLPVFIFEPGDHLDDGQGVNGLPVSDESKVPLFSRRMSFVAQDGFELNDRPPSPSLPLPPPTFRQLCTHSYCQRQFTETGIVLIDIKEASPSHNSDRDQAAYPFRQF